jgi:hypothetical protein
MDVPKPAKPAVHIGRLHQAMDDIKFRVFEFQQQQTSKSVESALAQA